MDIPTLPDIVTGENLVEESLLRLLVKTDVNYQYYIGPIDTEKHQDYNIKIDSSVNIPYNQPQYYLPEWSPNGRYLYIRDKNKNFHIYDSEKNYLEIFFFSRECIQFCFSPNSTYFCVYEKFVGEPNLRIYSIETNEVVFSLHIKANLSEQWPFIQFNSKDTQFCYLLNNKVYLYDISDLQKSINVNVDITTISINPYVPYYIAFFTKEKQGRPAKMSIYDMRIKKYLYTIQGFNAKESQYFWSSNGKNLIIKTEVEVDITGHSYYGFTMAYLLGEHIQERIMLDKSGPILDVCWNPSGKDFIVIGGNVPPQVTIFDSKGIGRFTFGNLSRNKVFWSPHTRFLILAGLGNLPGDIDIIDYYKKSVINSLNCPYIDTISWSADSRFFVVKVTHEKMKVDNHFTIFKYNGTEIIKIKFNTLYYCSWKPIDSTQFKDRPQSPKTLESHDQSTDVTKQPVKTAYIPPHLRDKGVEKNIPISYIEPKKINKPMNGKNNYSAHRKVGKVLPVAPKIQK